MASSDDTSTYLLIVTIGFVLTLIVGQVLMRAGVGFLREVFEDRDVAMSVTRLLAVAFHLIALGFLALVSTFDIPIGASGTVQLVVTKIGGILLFLGVLHVGTLLALAKVRNNRRVQTMAASLRGGNRRPNNGGGQGDQQTKALGT